MARVPTIALVLTLLTAAFAGCAQNAAQEAPGAKLPAAEFSIAREQLIDLSDGDLASLLDAEDADALMRALADARLVVRVSEPGVYAISYTDASGHPREELLGALTPGVPRTVEGVDPLSDARLLRDGAIVHARPVHHEAWWSVGALPMGFWIEPGADARYDYRMDVAGDLELLNVTHSEWRIDKATLSLQLPVRGGAGWHAYDEGADGTRLAYDTNVSLTPESDVVTFRFDGMADGAEGAMGFSVPPLDAASTGGFSLWAEGGQVTAGRFDGASARAQMRVLGWATGGFAELAADACPNGAAPEDPCEVVASPPYDSIVPAGEKTLVGENEPEREMTEAEADAWQRAFALVARSLSQGLVVGDSITVRASAPTGTIPGAEGAEASIEYVVAVAAREPIAVAAGSFDAFRVAQTARAAFQADSISIGLADVALDETITRTTVWLAASTYQPLKVETESPVDFDALVHRLVESIDPETWTAIGVGELLPESYHWTMTSKSALEARAIVGEQRFAPMMGLALANVLSTGLPFTGLALGGATAVPLPYGGLDAVAEPAYGSPARYVSIASAGPLVEGEKPYEVTSASEGLRWDDLMLTLDGRTLAMSPEDGCGGEAPPAGAFAVCRRATAYDARDPFVGPGDVLRLSGARPGDTMRILDREAQSVIVTVVVG